jgi:hypothetical protein
LLNRTYTWIDFTTKFTDDQSEIKSRYTSNNRQYWSGQNIMDNI